MKRLCIFVTLVVATCAVISAARTGQANPKKTVGTFDQKAIVIAFYRSPLWADTLKTKHAEQEQAKRANDTAKVQELESWGRQSQELAHQQLAGKAPITNILEALRPAFEQVKRNTGVSEIVPAPYQGEQQTVDVTNILLDWLSADENTRKIIADMKKK